MKSVFFMAQLKDISLTVLCAAVTNTDKYYLKMLHNGNRKPILIRTLEIHRHKDDKYSRCYFTPRVYERFRIFS